MDQTALLAAFDTQLRRRAEPNPGVEIDDTIIRAVPTDAGWTGVTWSNLNHTNAGEIIAAQITRFAELARPWEWKHYSYDQPADLPQRLRAAGFTAEPTETVLAAAIADLPQNVPTPNNVHLHTVRDETDINHFVALHNEVFGGDYTDLGKTLLADLATDTAAAVLAMADTTPVATARIEFHPGTEFASLWGGGTLAAWRGRGIFRAMVAHRARLAAQRGFRYLQVDATEDSRPILRRLGFTELATTTPFVHPGGVAPHSRTRAR